MALKMELWKEGIDVRDFIQKNYKLYEGDESFLEEQQTKTNEYGKKRALNYRRN